MYWTTYSASESSDEEETDDKCQTLEEIEYISTLEEEVVHKLGEAFMVFDSCPPWSILSTWKRPTKVQRNTMGLFVNLVDLNTLQRLSIYMGCHMPYHSSDVANTIYSSFSLNQIKVMFECATRWNSIHGYYFQSDTFHDTQYVDATIVMHFIKYMQMDRSLKCILK
jgi:hypothetical protein